MKKILSVVLSLMIVTGTLPAAYASGLSINNWNGFTGSGVTVANPDPAADSEDDVIQFAADESATLSLTEPVYGNVLVEFEFYAADAQNSEINVLAADGTAMGSFALSADGTCGTESYGTGKWHTAKILVFPDGKIYRTYLDDVYTGEGDIETASLVCKKLQFVSGGELYINNINVYNYALPMWSDDMLNAVYSNETDVTVNASNPLSVNTEFASAIIEANLDASDLENGNIKMILGADNGEDITVLDLSGTDIPSGAFAVTVNVSADSQTADVYIDDEKVSALPVSLLDAEKTPAGEIGELSLEVTGDGGVTVKSLYIKEQSPIKNAAGEYTKTIYEEDFEDVTAGNKIPYFDSLGGCEKMGATFTAVDATTGHATSQVGMLKYTNYYTSTSLWRFDDFGNTDTTAQAFSSGIVHAWFSNDISAKTEGIDNITLSFRYYNAKNSWNKEDYNDTSGITRDRLLAGFGTGSGSGELKNTNQTSVAYYVNHGEQKVDLRVNDTKKLDGSVVRSNLIQQWVNAELSIKENADGTATATVAGPVDTQGTVGSESVTLDEFPEIKYLSFQMERELGGKYYLDDIKVTTVITRAEDEYYTEAELMDISLAGLDPAYENDITRVETDVEEPDMPVGTVEETIENNKTVYYSNDFATAGVYGFEESENLTASAVYADNMGSVMSLTPTDSAASAKAVYKIGSITDTWDGTVDTSWYSASADSYEIWTGADLAGLAKLVNANTDFSGKTVKLMANIDLDNLNWTPIGTGLEIASKVYNSFKGTFDGNGHEIRNLSIRDTIADSESNTRNFGLFGRADGRIANLGINGTKIIITSNSIKCIQIAAIAAVFFGTIENCYAVDSELKEVRPETVEKSIKRISDGGKWTFSRDLVAPITASLGAGSNVNGCYTRDTIIYASWHSISSPLIAFSNGDSSGMCYVNNCYAAAPFTYTANPATGELGRVYAVLARGTTSYTTGANNYYTHTVEEYRGPGGDETKAIYGNGSSGFSETNGEMTAVTVLDLFTSLKSTNLYNEDIANINAAHPILKSQRLPVDTDEINIAFEAMVPTGGDADLVLYSGNEVAATISLDSIADNEWKTFDLAFRNGTYIPTINGVTGEAVEFLSENDGISEFAFVVNSGTAYVENLMIYKDSAELLKKKINKIMADIYEQVPDYPVLDNSLTLMESVDGYSVTWESSDKSYLSNKGEILLRKDCTMPVSLTATITLDPVNGTYAPADAEVTFNFMLAPNEGVSDETTVDAIIADILNNGYLTDEEYDSITKDLNTLPTEWDDAEITWEATGDAMDDEGKVTIPGNENETVTLTATIKLGDVEKTEAIEFTVLSYESILSNAADEITYELINGADANVVKKNLNFPAEGLYGTSIAWTSDRTDLITNRGFLMEITDEEYVNITATLSMDGRTKAVTLPFVTYISPTVKIASDMAEVTVVTETAESITVPVAGDYTTITWASNSTYAEVTNAGRINITRPEYIVGDTKVTLTATFTVDGVSASKDYYVLIKCLPSDTDLIQAELDKLDFTDISDEPDTAVSNNLHLVYDFPYNITATWTSDANESGVVTNDGVVTRPSIGNPDVAVVMTVTLERGETELSKNIPFTVKAYGSTQDVLDYAKAQLTFNTLSDDPINLVVEDLYLPKAWKYGTEVSWTSDSDLIKVEDGTDGHYKGTVTKAAFGAPNKPVTLTATISYEGQTISKEFYVTVAEEYGYEPLIYTDFEVLTRGVNYAADRNNLGGGTYEHNNQYQITVAEADPTDATNTVLEMYKTPDMPHLDGGVSWAFFRTNTSQRRAGIIRIEQDLYLESMSNLEYKIVGSIGGGNDGNWEDINITIDKDGAIRQWKADYTASKKMEFGKWNNLAIEFSTYEKWIDVYLNGELVLDNAPFQWQKDGTNISALKIKLQPSSSAAVKTAEDTHTLYIDNLKVLRKVDYSGEMAAAEKELETAFLAAQNINEITENIVIPTLSKYDLEVSGKSSNTAVVANDGTVTRPATDTEVEYTVTLSSEFGGARSRTFKLLVRAEGYIPGQSGGTVTDAEKVVKDATAAISALKNSYTLNYITGNITLPVTADNGSTITWKSLNTDVVSNSGTVTRSSTDTTVTLICTATLNGVSARQEVTVTVKAGTTTSTPVIIPSTTGGTTGGVSGVLGYDASNAGSDTAVEPGTSSFIFDDVMNHWAKDYIMELYSAGVINGVSDTEFAPDDSISREAFLTMLIRALGNELGNDYDAVFDDVKPDDWYYQYVMAAFDMGIVNGVSATEFGTGSNISRQDLCTMIARALENMGIEIDAETAEEFADTIAIEIYAKDAVYGLKNLGIIDGKDDNNFDPRGNATRAEAAKIISGLMSVLSEKNN